MQNKRVELKNKIKGIAKAALALSMSLVMPLTSIPVSAAENHEMLDPDRIGSISADVIVDNGFKFVTDERFAGAGTIPDTDEALDAANLDLAEKMAATAKSYAYDVQPKAMDAQGKVSFEGLEVGLYLVVQAAQGEGDNKFVLTPFLITIPQKNPDGSLVYDVDAQSKPLGIGKVVPTPPSPPTPSHLPQTGQMWWPVVLLAGLGVIAFCFGMIRKNRQ